MTSRILLRLAPMLLLAGCSIFETPRSAPGTPERSCEDAADADPRIKHYAEMNPTPYDPGKFTAAYEAARQQLIDQCVRVRKGLPQGGVEKVIQ
jgi:hypothetical protein